MQIPVQITVRGMARSAAMDRRIEKKVASLERFHPRITGCRVTVSDMGRHSAQGRQFEVRIDVRVPGHAEIVVSRQHDEDVYVAIRDAFDAAVRQIEEVARQKRGDVKSHEPLQQGRIKRIVGDEGFGFIETTDGRELYFSRDNVVHPAFDQLTPGMSVHFIEATAGDGLQAKRVSGAKHGPSQT